MKVLKSKKVKIECDSCGITYTLTFKSRKSPQCCAFCGEEVVFKDVEFPLLNSLEDLDQFEEEDFYAQEDFED